MRDTFRALAYAEDVKAVVITGEDGNFCSGGSVNDIIGPLLDLDMAGLLNFTRMTGDLVKAIRYAPQPVIAAIDGICAGAGGAVAMACDIRFGTPDCKTLYLFNRVGLAGCDMGACAILPRIIGQGRASELLYTGRAMTADEGERWGFFNRLVEPDKLLAEAQDFARRLADGPTFGNAMTKKMLDMEWTMGLEQYIEAEAQAQAICMQTQDYHRAYPRLRGEGEAGVRGELGRCRTPPTWSGRSWRIATATWHAICGPGPPSMWRHWNMRSTV